MFDVRITAALFVCWELAFRAARMLCRRSSHPVIRSNGASYCTSVVNAAWCALAGGYLLRNFVQIPVASCAAVDPVDPNAWVGVATKAAAYPFLSWLCMDFMHIAVNFPRSGGPDALAHHFLFILLTSLLMSYEVLPVVGAWLMLGELSTLPLNARWFLINSGRGDSRALFVANCLFALCFLLSRVLVFWAGVAHMLLYLRPLLLSAPFYVPRWVVDPLCGAVTAAGFLNAWWMRRIIQMALRSGEHERRTSSKQD